jgi:hypothetical protein
VLRSGGYTTGTGRQGAFKDRLGHGGVWAGKERRMALVVRQENGAWQRFCGSLFGFENQKEGER